MLFANEGEDVDLCGLSPRLAIPIEPSASDRVLAFEVANLEKRYGRYGLRWWIVANGLLRFEGRWLDQLHIVADGWPLRVYFDVTNACERYAEDVGV